MGKIRNTYRAYTNTELKSRASIPLQADITTGTGNIDCVNISLARVKNLLGEPYFSVPSVCTSSKVNKWSGFSPKVMGVTNPGRNGVITWSNPTTYRLSDFAGYNHYAITPSYYSTTHADTVTTTTSGQSVQVEVQFDIGELILTDINSAMGIALCVLDEGPNYHTHAARALSTLKDQCRASNSLAFTVYVAGPTGISSWDNPQKIDYLFELFLISGTDLSFNTNEIAKLFPTELPPFTKRIRKQFPTVMHTSIQPGYTCPYSDYVWNIGRLSCIVAKDTGSGHGTISATIYNHLNQQVGYHMLYDGDVDTGGVTISNYNIGTLPQYDYHIQLSFSTH